MKKIYIQLIVVLLSNGFLLCKMYGQQTPVFANYDYNAILINPAHAGFYPNTDVTLTNRGYLNQIDGSPRNIGLTFNTPLNSRNVGLGAGFSSDKIGVTTATSLFASYAYKIIFDHNYNRARWWSYNPNVLSFGITGGILLYNENLQELGIQNDPNFENNINTTIPTIGIGILYNREHIYVGFSASNVLVNSLASDDNINLDNPLYAYMGYRFFTTRFQELMIKPNVLIKYVSGAPIQTDLNLTVNYKNRIEGGLGYRTNSSINFLAGFYFFDHWRLLYNYNQTLRSNPINNTHGIILSYRFGAGFSNKG
ncbi:PorP/SprF family type IX secretion system membrane protein [uncultured Aquimarina sp.]|uniref:PorP/SprF family type IX secretion system membrane protein n=1 Tax=uncultured Aquimarina sp. TaxID=575652 RepID=UPI002611D902|nr:PorP/SprF family type IX secretion system membrane protein [uncultured Aquimarina sp.]